jgi:hypothetical protein
VLSSWEDRMAAAAAARREAAEAEQRRAEEENDPHRGHHAHIEGTCVVCSCGENFGVTCVALPPELAELSPEEAQRWWTENVRCSVCGKPGVFSAAG